MEESIINRFSKATPVIIATGSADSNSAVRKGSGHTMLITNIIRDTSIKMPNPKDIKTDKNKYVKESLNYCLKTKIVYKDSLDSLYKSPDNEMTITVEEAFLKGFKVKDVFGTCFITNSYYFDNAAVYALNAILGGLIHVSV